MADIEPVRQGILALPNEILLNILGTHATPALLPIALTCHHFHSLVLRLLHYRMQVAAGLDNHTLYLECGPPAAKWTTSKVFCSSLGTDGLDQIGAALKNHEACVGHIGSMHRLYSRFRPVSKEPDHRPRQRAHPAGDIPGSRTYPAPGGSEAEVNHESDAVIQTVTVDAHCLFSQLEIVSYLGRRESTRGLLFSIQEVCDGIIRVQREWLARQCEYQKDHAHHVDNAATESDPTEDPSILWITTKESTVGIKFGVRAQRWRENQPVIYANDDELTVSYEVELKAISVRTTHLLLKLEEARKQIANESGKAVVFGSYIDQIT